MDCPFKKSNMEFFKNSNGRDLENLKKYMGNVSETPTNGRYLENLKNMKNVLTNGRDLENLKKYMGNVSETPDIDIDYDVEITDNKPIQRTRLNPVKKLCPCDEEKDKEDKEGLFESFINLIKNMAGENDLYRAISLYEFYVNIILLIFIISTQNTFLAILFIGLFSKQIPERIIKTFLSRKNGKLTDLAKRPQGANNCNMFNAGGDAREHSGLISGHTFLISTLGFYFIYRFTDQFKHNANYKQYIFISFLFIWIALVAMARMRLKCHKPHQTLLGFLMGALWGYLIYIVIEAIKNKSDRVKEDENAVMKLFEI
jgi:membrane-associated phospholipid phosphatase